MTFRVEFTDAATAQAEAAARWWQANRPAAPELFDDELAYALDLLARMPPPTQVWGEVEGKKRWSSARSGAAPTSGSSLFEALPRCSVRGALKRRKTSLTRSKPSSKPSYDAVLADVVALIEAGRRAAVRASNVIMTSTYWGVGRRIVEEEQHGAARAEYGKELMTRLSADLTRRFGRGFGQRNVFHMRAFYLAYRGEILQTASARSPKLEGTDKLQTASAISGVHGAPTFPLPWSHYVRLLSVKNLEARRFYEGESLRGGWNIRQLDRQIGTQFYERTALSRNKAAMLRQGRANKVEDVMTPEEEIKDPFFFEFLDLKDEYSESDLEAALIAKLESFLLELGGDFTFVGRQRRLRVGDAWYRIDVLFFHRRLRCLVIIDLKLDKLTHADAGQMHLYLNYAREHWMLEGENPPVGLILCAERDHAVAHYALEGLPNKVMAAEYRTALPKERALVAEIEKTIHHLESRRAAVASKRPSRKKG